MVSVLPHLSGRAVIAASFSLMSGIALAQAQDAQSSPLKPRQPTRMSVEKLEEQQAAQDKSKSQLDRKVREMDRRLNRTMRSVCVGC